VRTNIVLDDELVKQGLELTHLQTRRELVHLALSELVKSRRKKKLTELAGQIRLRDDFDHKLLRSLRGSYSDSD
jgi:Arc/MetJ family transcription regulator